MDSSVASPPRSVRDSSSDNGHQPAFLRESESKTIEWEHTRRVPAARPSINNVETKPNEQSVLDAQLTNTPLVHSASTRANSYTHKESSPKGPMRAVKSRWGSGLTKPRASALGVQVDSVPRSDRNSKLPSPTLPDQDPKPASTANVQRLRDGSRLPRGWRLIFGMDPVEVGRELNEKLQRMLAEDEEGLMRALDTEGGHVKFFSSTAPEQNVPVRRNLFTGEPNSKKQKHRKSGSSPRVKPDSENECTDPHGAPSGVGNAAKRQKLSGKIADMGLMTAHDVSGPYCDNEAVKDDPFDDATGSDAIEDHGVPNEES